PNDKELGQGIFTLNKTQQTKTPMTMYYHRRLLWQPAETKKVIAYLKKRGMKIEINPSQHLLQTEVGPGEDIQKTLHDIWLQVSTAGRSAKPPSYDSGMMETLMPYVTYQGKAYETRHRFIGKLGSGDCILKKADEGRLKGSFARIGSSRYFSNRTGRGKWARVLKWPNMYSPLYEIYSIPADLQREFEEKIDRLIELEYIYLTRRLKAAGIHLDATIEGQFDLIWLPPESEKGNPFPIPLIIEAEIVPKEEGILGHMVWPGRPSHPVPLAHGTNGAA